MTYQKSLKYLIEDLERWADVERDYEIIHEREKDTEASTCHRFAKEAFLRTLERAKELLEKADKQ